MAGPVRKGPPLCDIHRTSQLRRALALFRGAGAFGPEPSAGRPAIGHVATQGDTRVAKTQHSGRAPAHPPLRPAPDKASLLKHYTLADDDIEHVRERRRSEKQLGLKQDDLLPYAVREGTRREHLVALRRIYAYRMFKGKRVRRMKS